MANTIVGLDLGTTKIACIIAEVDRDQLKIVGVGTCSSEEGLRRGVVVNLEKTARAIEKAVSEAELMAGVKINSVYAGIAGDHIRSINSRGVIAVSRGGNEISQADVDRVIDAAQAVAIPMDREILHVIPQGFIVDDQKGIKDPIGMAGVRLEVEVHIVTGAVASAENIYKSIKRAGLKVDDLVLQPLASSYAVLTPDEKSLGVALLDIGGGTTDIAMFFEDSIRHTAVIGLGGNNLTSDIAIGLRTPTEQAESIKKKYGCATMSQVKEDEMIGVFGVAGREEREVSRQVLAQIIEPRMEEIFSLASREIKRSDYGEMLGAGVVLTGGAAKLPGAASLAEQVFNQPARVGEPRGISGVVDLIKDPMYATGVGLVLYGYDRRFKGESIDESNPFDSILSKMRGWFGDLFNS
jgi:cell division protein FtsA